MAIWWVSPNLLLNISLTCFSWADSGEHKLTVTATDKSGKSAFQSVQLIVQPVQNIPPSFPYVQQRVEILETTVPGTPIFRTVAHDPDGLDVSLRYYIHSQPEPDLFTIDESSGMLHLSLTGKLDFETQPNLVPITVRGKLGNQFLVFIVLLKAQL